eukprot:156739-Amphidinium_carterae.1
MHGASWQLLLSHSLRSPLGAVAYMSRLPMKSQLRPRLPSLGHTFYMLLEFSDYWPVSSWMTLAICE